MLALQGLTHGKRNHADMLHAAAAVALLETAIAAVAHVTPSEVADPGHLFLEKGRSSWVTTCCGQGLPELPGTDVGSSLLSQRSIVSLPQFYFPRPVPQGEEAQRAEFTRRIDDCFSTHPGGMPQKTFVDMVNEVCACNNREEARQN